MKKVEKTNETKSSVLFSCLEAVVTVVAVIPCPPSMAWLIIASQWPKIFRGCKSIKCLDEHPTLAKLPRAVGDRQMMMMTMTTRTTMTKSTKRKTKSK